MAALLTDSVPLPVRQLLDISFMEGMLHAHLTQAPLHLSLQTEEEGTVFFGVCKQLLAGLAAAAEAMPAPQLQPQQQPLAALRSALAQLPSKAGPAASQQQAVRSLRSDALPPATRVAAALLDWWRRPEQQQEDALALAQAAAARSCAYLRCPNVGGEGGPAAGQGAGSQRCRCG